MGVWCSVIPVPKPEHALADVVVTADLAVAWETADLTGLPGDKHRFSPASACTMTLFRRTAPAIKCWNTMT